ncbi:hypothetical protein NQ314_005124 [Rhamnusium bicolor]|uniref:Uncharacterized protein n=1 Tax=Rhamnusium bicolor TaxID=1586634 RepID=A0AAV8ZHS3_9CUCU|nr:hypothetical protein NQ314_005124 [Rhamnusium bicolor]
MFQFVRNFINYWYFRYLLVTELYMVEKWERAMFRILFEIMVFPITHRELHDKRVYIIILVLLSVLYLFNTTIVLGLARMVLNSLFIQDALKEEHVYEEL